MERNSEILFIYDAKLTNPNGDMDNENKPRMDYDTSTNLVSDVRLKRYIRDYFETNLGMEIFITNKAEDAKERGKQLDGKKKDHTELIDCRLFGAVYAVKGDNKHLTGPVQFNWGYSLNPVELNESSTITSSFSSGQGVGKDFRVKYSLIAFSGGINAHAAKDTKLTEADIDLFDEAMIAAIPAARTRSKTGQAPRLYLRVQATDNKLVLKDLREYLKLDYKTDNEYAVRSIGDITLDISSLNRYLEKHKEKIEKIFFWCDDNIQVTGLDELKAAFDGKLQEVDPAER
jgi:CRISPR-associated protein Csh2